MTQKQLLVVVGTGMVGARFVEELIARGGADRFRIVMFGEEPYGTYNRILLSSVLAGSHDPKDILISPLSWYEEHGIELHAGVPVTAVDRNARRVHGATGVRCAYAKLVIATGSSPVLPPMSGLEAPEGGFKEGVFVFRTLDDCQAIVRAAGRARRAAVIGGGLLGLEAARGLLHRGLEVHVVHLKAHLMEMQLDPPAGQLLQRSLEGMGLRVLLEKETAAVVGGSRVTGLEFRDGSVLECDMVVIAAGIRPRVGLAAQAGLAVERGIVVNDALASISDPDVFAIGECAQHRGRVYGLVAPLWEQAMVLAERLSDRNPEAQYRGSRLSTKLKVAGLDLAVMGAAEPCHQSDEVITYVEPSRGIYKKLIVCNGRVGGAIVLGDGATVPPLLQAFDRASEVPENRAELLFPLAASSATTGAADLPESVQICNCNGVSKGAIVAAARNGHRSLKALCDATRAGTGCGSCKPTVQAILEAAAGDLVQEDPSVHYYVPGVPLSKPDLIAAVRGQNLRSVSAVFAALAGGKEDPASKVGLASLLKTIWGRDYEDERDARFINDRVHANIQRDGTFSVVPRIYGGVVTPAQLRRIADVAEKYRVPMVKITGGQRIDLLGIPKERLPAVWSELGMPSGHAYTKAFRTCKTCVGTDFCRYGVGDSTALGIAIERRFQGIEAPHKMKLAAAGCPRNCSEATTKDLGAVAIEGGKWEVYVGGAAGSRVRKGDVLCVIDRHEDVLKYMGRFMQYYREHAKYLERTYDFVERIGIERLRRTLVDDADGICGRLDAEIQAAVDAYRDPWEEAANPVYPAQFTTTLRADPGPVALQKAS
ncbi:MAG TPA: nitrite reductase large subunit NirB [Gemmatimonadales bacterium]|nr:nitrite reductase large subunit NirB [Gemmatimonadales bacterium]